MLLIALLCGKDSTSRLCLAAELGQDTRRTCAALGAILGILDPVGFEPRFTDPIGEGTVISAGVTGICEPLSLSAFCRRIAELCTDTLQYYHSKVNLKDAPFFSKNCTGPFMQKLSDLPPFEDGRSNEALIAVRPFAVTLTYPEQIACVPGECNTYTLTVTDTSHRCQSCGLRIIPCEGMAVSPRNRILHFDENHTAVLSFNVTVESGKLKRSVCDLLIFRFDINGLDFDCTAGLAATYDFLRIACDERPLLSPTANGMRNAFTDRSACHFRSVPKGGFLYSAEFRHPVPVADAVLAVTGTRAMAVWIDDKPVSEHDSIEYIPAFHRCENIIPLSLDTDWHRLTVWVAPASEPKMPDTRELRKTDDLPLRAQRFLYDRKHLSDEDKGELFIGFSSRQGFRYLHEMEWRLPKYNIL